MSTQPSVAPRSHGRRRCSISTRQLEAIVQAVDRMKDGTLTWDPDVFGFSSGVVGLQLGAPANDLFVECREWIGEASAKRSLTSS